MLRRNKNRKECQTGLFVIPCPVQYVSRRTSHVQFADDTVLITEYLEDRQQMVDKGKEVSEENGLSLNTLILGNDNLDVEETYYKQTEAFERWTQSRILTISGGWSHKKGDIEKDEKEKGNFEHFQN